MHLYYTHPDNPQPQVLKQAVNALTKDQLIVYPEAFGYQLALSLSSKNALTQAQRIAQQELQFTLICHDLSQMSQYVQINNFAHRILKNALGMGIDFILPATKTVPKNLICNTHKGIAIRMATTPITHAILDFLTEPFVSLPMIINGDEKMPDDVYELESLTEKLVDGFIHVGNILTIKPALVSLMDEQIQIIQHGDIDLSQIL